ncbi:kynurenine formamidase [Catenuloplanes nepalensis]|uniref:Kynurenine formamidase n=1 Tax=Catenuloplanes nepalensis TaxID=587533 RepID=A0ABT9MZD2_9ACTN|nr:cyclase family protein [Catenuloplanes nepalensis]MDP9796795.1 kynurenine formamidase [Catenuloplanes nepalensis]
MCTEECLRHAASPQAEVSRAAVSQAAVSRRAALAGLAAAGLTLGAPAPAAAATHGHHTVRDLTHPFTTTFPTFAPGEEARRGPYKTIPDDGYYMQEWRIVEHTGTHVDAPVHFVPNGRTATQLTPDELVLPAVTIDLQRRVAQNPDTILTVADLRAWEREWGRIPTGAAVLLHTGWDRRATSATRYRNPDATGTMHFPGFGPDACEWLLSARNVRCLGIDTLSLDPGRSPDYPVHFTLLGADRYGIENLTRLESVPARGATLVVGLVPWEQGSGGPARILALV